MPRAGEHVLTSDDIAARIAPIYNAANLSESSTQDERHEAFTSALKTLVARGVLTPRALPDSDGRPRLCLVRTIVEVVDRARVTV